MKIVKLLTNLITQFLKGNDILLYISYHIKKQVQFESWAPNQPPLPVLPLTFQHNSSKFWKLVSSTLNSP